MIQFQKDVMGEGGEIVEIKEEYSFVTHCMKKEHTVLGVIETYKGGASFRKTGTHNMKHFKNSQQAIKYGLRLFKKEPVKFY